MKKIYFAVAFGMLATAMLTSSCVKDDFADPVPSSDTTSITRNTTIAELKGQFGFGVLEITKDLFPGRDSVIIEGYVISDDKAGNFYKSFYIQDATGGIEIKLGKTTIYNDYKRGQRVVVVCNGLSLGEYGGMTQLGSTYAPNGVMQIGGIETDYIINKHIYKKGKVLCPVKPDVISSFSKADLGTLVKVENVQFRTLTFEGTPITYADSKGQITRNRDLVHKDTETSALITVRTSGYAAFAGDVLPSENGFIVGVLSVYNGEYQLLLRDTKDVVFDKPRQ